MFAIVAISARSVRIFKCMDIVTGGYAPERGWVVMRCSGSERRRPGVTVPGSGQDILGGWSIFRGMDGGGVKLISGEERTMGWGRNGREACKTAGLCSWGEQP